MWWTSHNLSQPALLAAGGEFRLCLAWLTVWCGVCQQTNTMAPVHNGPASLLLECKTCLNGFQYCISEDYVTRQASKVHSTICPRPRNALNYHDFAAVCDPKEKPCICCLSVLEMYDSVKRMISVHSYRLQFSIFFYLYFSYKVKSFLKLLLNRKEMFF